MFSKKVIKKEKRDFHNGTPLIRWSAREEVDTAGFTWGIARAEVFTIRLCKQEDKTPLEATFPSFYSSWNNFFTEFFAAATEINIYILIGKKKIQTVNPTTSVPCLLSNSSWKTLAVILLSWTPCPRPRLSSCISRRSMITSSWPERATQGLH